MWDAEGKQYLDLFPGWGCNILGYCPPRVVRAIQEQVEQLIHVPNTWYIEAQGRFAEAICSRSFGKAFFCNSGAEANEGAIKLARLHAKAGAVQDHHVRERLSRSNVCGCHGDGSAEVSRGTRSDAARVSICTVQRSRRRCVS